MCQPVESQPPNVKAAAAAGTIDNLGASPARIPVATPVGPLNEAHYALLRRAAALRRPVRRAVRTARFSAFSMLVVGVAGIPVALIFPDLSGILVVALICVLGLIELIGSRRLQRGLASAAVLLGINQLCVLATVVLYCCFQLTSFSDKQVRAALVPPELQAQIVQLPGLQHDLDQQIQSWAPTVSYLLYGTVIVLSVAMQGGLAVYYFTRCRHVTALTSSTPPWIKRVLAELGE